MYRLHCPSKSIILSNICNSDCNSEILKFWNWQSCERISKINKFACFFSFQNFVRKRSNAIHIAYVYGLYQCA